jgi:hypothetical protein
MYAAEIVVREVQRDGHLEIQQLFAESVRQTCESADRHTHREILALYKASRDVVRIGITAANSGYNLHDWTWGVPRVSVMLAPFAKQLYYLREVYV